MKAFLFVLLVAVIFCETVVKKDTLDVVTCLLRSDVIHTALAEVVEAVRTKDKMTILVTLANLYAPVTTEVKKCLA